MTATAAHPANPVTGPLTVRTVAERFIELCNEGRNFDIMRTMYSADIISVEGDGQATVGQQLVIQKSEQFGQFNTITSQMVHGPWFNGNSNSAKGQFAVHFVHEVTPKHTGKSVTYEEVAVYTVIDGLITHEKFYYDGHR